MKNVILATFLFLVHKSSGQGDSINFKKNQVFEKSTNIFLDINRIEGVLDWFDYFHKHSFKKAIIEQTLCKRNNSFENYIEIDECISILSACEAILINRESKLTSLNDSLVISIKSVKINREELRKFSIAGINNIDAILYKSEMKDIYQQDNSFFLLWKRTLLKLKSDLTKLVT